MAHLSPRSQHHADQHSAAIRNGDTDTAQQHLEQIALTGTDQDVTALGQAIATAMNLVDQQNH
ncbi:hypothetical protein ACH4TX_41745 [Streptomyces sp. NPDC021098]|uniref:hypothetical protein n=1 Tax=unclassified Streptomyces TaxID=2593676 RepID=UPI0037B8726D